LVSATRSAWQNSPSGGRRKGRHNPPERTRDLDQVREQRRGRVMRHHQQNEGLEQEKP
jgi:hypothetical protein